MQPERGRGRVGLLDGAPGRLVRLVEGQSTVGVGTRARLPFRISALPGPGSSERRGVVDVAIRW